MESFNNMLAIMIAVILMFIFPLLYFAQKQDMITQIYVSNETTNFVNNIKNKGYLTSDMYQRYIENIGNTNNVYKVEIKHSRKMVNAEYDEDSGELLEEYYIVYIDYYEDEIIQALSENNIYYFSQGDYISLKVSNKVPTLASKIMQALYKTNIPNEQILVTYGGMIRDEAW
ncbi:MAG TPA: hypothetical protein GXZ90_08725 [Clostridiales bacterium]|nr:hypothetical protein [Clostridiales bacterium]